MDDTKEEQNSPPPPAAAPPPPARPFRGVRMRKWGKWVAEIREPNKRSRIWLGSYTSPVAAARAYDTAVFLLRGPAARLNFPAELDHEETTAGISLENSSSGDLPAALIRQRATEVGARVDLQQRNRLLLSPENSPANSPENSPANSPANSMRIGKKPDLNEQPSSSDDG